MHKPNLSAVAIALILLLAPANGGPLFPTHKTQVTIANKLVSRAPLQVHCKAKDVHAADLGAHQVPFNAVYAFGLTATYSGTADCLCGFVWNNEYKWFDIYEERRDFDTCGFFCAWEVKESGPCLVLGHGSGSGGVSTSSASRWRGRRCYPWNKPNAVLSP